MPKPKITLTSHSKTGRWTEEQRLRVAGPIMAAMIHNPLVDDDHILAAAKATRKAVDALEAAMVPK